MKRSFGELFEDYIGAVVTLLVVGVIVVFGIHIVCKERKTIWHAPPEADIRCPTSRDNERTCVGVDGVYTCVTQWDDGDAHIYCARRGPR